MTEIRRDAERGGDKTLFEKLTKDTEDLSKEWDTGLSTCMLTSDEATKLIVSKHNLLDFISSQMNLR